MIHRFFVVLRADASKNENERPVQNDDAWMGGPGRPVVFCEHQMGGIKYFYRFGSSEEEVAFAFLQ